MRLKLSFFVKVSIVFVFAGWLQSLALDANAQTGKLSQLNSISNSFEILSKNVSPSVVQIFATGYSVPASVNRAGPAIAREFHSGSGVILNEQGYIITNAHVVSGADRIRVLLAITKDNNNPQQSILKPRGMMVDAKIIGQDGESDLAVIKVDVSNLPALSFGDSDDLRQGQLVFAFGSPLGLENSVSMGIISSIARQFRLEDPMIYLQTDASINPGNSGGPLVDTEGKLVGINTFILSQSGGNEGIGFAVPSNIVKNVYEQIMENGRVRRGEIGVNAQTISTELAAGLGLSKDWGVILGDVYPGGPADRVGLRVGDIVLALNGKIMENGRQFDVNLYNRLIGEIVSLKVQRPTGIVVIPVVVYERQDDPHRFYEMVSPEKNLVSRLGALVLDLYPEVMRMLPVLRKQYGVVIASVSPGTPAANAGLLPGDVIHSVNNITVGSISELRTRIGAAESGGFVVLQVARKGELMYIVVEL